jgi:RNA-directed DNA polymerase
MANIALSALDEHFAQAWSAMGSEWERRKRKACGEPAYRLVRYADDFVVVLAGQRQHAEVLVAETAAVLAPLGLTLSDEKTRITHIDEGIEFLGWRVQRHRASNGHGYVYTYASKPSLAAVKRKVKTITRSGHNQTLGQLLHRLNPVLRGWYLFPWRGVRSHLQLPARLHLATGYLLAAPQTPQGGLALA